MKMILNEYRLMPWQKEAQDLVAKHMEDFFFGEGAALPPGYVHQQATGTAPTSPRLRIATARAGTAAGPPTCRASSGLTPWQMGSYCSAPMPCCSPLSGTT